jgi:4-hydroxy-tetrahydrodipicolinate reductase
MNNEKFKYGIIGSSGKLGHEVSEVFSENKGQLVFTVRRSKEWSIDKPDLLVDCSFPEVLDKTVSLVHQFNVPLVIATTGFSSHQLNVLKKLSETVPVVQSYNFSVGIQVLLYLVDQAKNILHNWDVEIEETHHRFKIDKPSGTSIMIRNIFKNKPVNISSLRLGDIVGDHSVHFGGLGEVITIKHSATSRRMFAQGILKAAEFSLQKKNGFFSFSDVIYSDSDFQI